MVHNIIYVFDDWTSSFTQSYIFAIRVLKLQTYTWLWHCYELFLSDI